MWFEAVNISLMGKNCICCGICGFVMANKSRVSYSTGLYWARFGQPWQEIHGRLHVMGHVWPSTLIHYGKPVMSQYQATTGPELYSNRFDYCYRMVRDGNSSNTSTQNTAKHCSISGDLSSWFTRYGTSQLNYFFGRIMQNIKIKAVHYTCEGCNAGICLSDFDLDVGW